MADAEDTTELQRRHDQGYRGTIPRFECAWVAERVLAGRNCLTAWDVQALETLQQARPSLWPSPLQEDAVRRWLAREVT